ncbi:putative membrane protein [Pseudomonas asplenii]|uniref:Putative membrane protein n=1 Tax=Pseudomonas asplenii TaxID=53407 RepID=A0A0M9GC28_9PSED|nr:putative membrane protein [Pseudomonas fuscovaginae]
MLVDAVKMSLHLDAVMGFVLYLLVALLVFGLYACLYTRMTPHREWTLIREGNIAAAIALGGALIGFAIPAASAIAHSVSLVDFLIWALIALVAQLLAFGLVSLSIRGLSVRIAKGESAAAILSAAISISVGLLNAACMTPPV